MKRDEKCWILEATFRVFRGFLVDRFQSIVIKLYKKNVIRSLISIFLLSTIMRVLNSLILKLFEENIENILRYNKNNLISEIKYFIHDIK